MSRTLILGGPGAGKTEALIREVERALAAGVNPHEIAYVSFTTVAADTAKNRAMSAFGFEAADMRWFCTIHALAKRSLRINSRAVPDGYKIREFGRWIGESLSGINAMDDPFGTQGLTRGDKMFFILGYASACRISLHEAWEKQNQSIDVTWAELDRFARGWTQWKQDHRLVDFSDMLERYIENGEPLDVKLTIIDEAQDLSAAQWAVAFKAFGNCDDWVVGADDDQAIHVWAGSDVSQLLTLPNFDLRVLPKSWRLPKAIFDYAKSLVEGKLTARYEKNWAPRDGEHGVVVKHCSIDDVPVGKPGYEGSWYLLARNKCYTEQFVDMCYKRGLIFSAKNVPSSVLQDDIDAIYGLVKLHAGEKVSAEVAKLISRAMGLKKIFSEALTYGHEEVTGTEIKAAWFEIFTMIPDWRRSYYMAVLRDRGLDSRPEIYIGTVHSVKGGEADHVAVLTDVTQTTADNWEEDAERRVAYVGATRSKKSLWIVAPSGINAMPYT